MSELNKNYFKEKGSKTLLNTLRCEIYIPDYYLDAKLAIQDGEVYDLFFIAKYRLIHKETDDVSKLPIHDFMIPTMILTKPDEVVRQEMNLYGITEKFSVFIYHREGEILYNNKIVKTSNMVERFITLLNDGKIRVPYSKVNDVTNKVQKIHDVKLNVPQYIQQLTISEVYRDKNDFSNPARLAVSDKEKDNRNLKSLNMRENSAFTSTLAGVSFEDIKSMLTVADNRDDKNDKTIGSIEKAIRGIRD